MKLNRSFLAAICAASTLLAVNASPHDPKPQSSDMKGHDMSKMQGHDMKGHSAGSKELHKITMASMKMPMHMSGSVDKDFATMMTMHHQQALKMADVMITHGGNAQLKTLARKMKSAQQAEIRQMAPYAK